ncbi:MAG: NADH:ubiquinone reductase (Na(+)-transporting) subunit A, partial [Rikenellaceae bacterium]|nr:NADH:ubiquinone reductase (Na(+)-transporting) subunit A [Rikenellaceae bacterium]
INKGERVWTVDVQAVAMIGRLMLTGSPDFTKTVAVTGSEVNDARYVQVISGAAMGSIICKSNLCSQELYLRGDWNSVRLICGNVLTGSKVDKDGYLGFYCNQVTAIPEGNHHELLGWAMPRLNKFSVSRAYFSWLMPWKKYDLDTNLNGGERAYVFTGLYDHYVPMDIYPMYLIKAILAGDIDKMENLGIYEVVEEDLALCEFVDPSKTEIQQIVRDGINLMIKEL